MEETKPIRVLIADDFKFLRDVIRLYLQLASDMEVIGEAPDLDDALESARALQPDVIIMNDYLPPLDSAHAAALFRKSGFTGAILVISMHPEPTLIRHSFDKGVNGFMDKDEIDTHLQDAIRQLQMGARYLSPKTRAIYGSTAE